jgi:hypothetical protein
MIHGAVPRTRDRSLNRPHIGFLSHSTIFDANETSTGDRLCVGNPLNPKTEIEPLISLIYTDFE